MYWVVQVGGTGPDRGNAISVDSSGSSYVTGSFRGETIFDGITLTSAGAEDIFIAKYGNHNHVFSSGHSYHRERFSDHCRAVFTSYTERPKLVCDFFDKAAVRASFQEISQSSLHEKTEQPDYMNGLYDSLPAVLALGPDQKASNKELKLLRESIKNVPGGDHFSKTDKSVLIKNLKISKTITSQLIDELIIAANSIEIDRLCPSAKVITISDSKTKVLKFGKLAKISSPDFDKGLSITFSLDSNLTFFNKINKHNTGWPAFSYRFDTSPINKEKISFDLTFSFGCNLLDVMAHSDISNMMVYVFLMCLNLLQLLLI